MGIRTLLRRAKREEQRHGIAVQPAVNGAPNEDLPPVRQMEVSQETLDLLIKGKDTLLQRRQQLIEQIQTVEGALMKQQGGIDVMTNLLQGQKPGKAPPEEKTEE